MDDLKRSKQDSIKYKLAIAMKEIMKTTPLERISINSIVAECGVSRQTFYRNFHDKYDLIDWYYNELLIQRFLLTGRGEPYKESWVKKLTFMQSEKDFYMGAYRNQAQNFLREYDAALVIEAYRKYIMKKTGQSISEDVDFMLELFCRGALVMAIKWVRGKSEDSPERMAEKMIKSMPLELADIFEKISLL